MQHTSENAEPRSFECITCKCVTNRQGDYECHMQTKTHLKRRNATLPPKRVPKCGNNTNASVVRHIAIIVHFGFICSNVTHTMTRKVSIVVG